MSESDRQKYLLGALLAVLGAVMFSAKAVFIKLAYRVEVDAITLLTLRMCFALPMFLIIYYINGKKQKSSPLSPVQLRQIIFLGMVGYYLASYLDFYGLKFITASLERLILFVYPTMVVIIGAIYFKRKISWVQIAAILLTYAGIVIIFFENLHLGGQDNLVLGAVLIFFSALTYAIYLVGSQGLIQATGAVRFTALAMIVSSICVIIHYLVTQDVAGLFKLDSSVYWIALAIAIISTVFPSFLISKAIAYIGSSNVSIIGGIGPVSTLIMAYLFLGERLTLLQTAGTVVVIVAVLIVSLKKDT